MLYKLSCKFGAGRGKRESTSRRVRKKPEILGGSKILVGMEKNYFISINAATRRGIPLQ